MQICTAPIKMSKVYNLKVLWGPIITGPKIRFPVFTPNDGPKKCKVYHHNNHSVHQMTVVTEIIFTHLKLVKKKKNIQKASYAV